MESPDRNVGCRVTVSARPEEVKQACRDWARDMRWFTADPGTNGPCVFHLARMSWTVRNPTIEAAVSPNEPGTDVEFRASLNFTNPPLWDDDLTALAETFARGVCCELARKGATVEPPSLASPCPNRRRQKTIARVVVPVFYAALVGCIPLGFLVGAITGALLGSTVAVWLAICILMASLVRYRTTGVRARAVLFVTILFLIPALGLTIACAVSY